MRRTLVVVLSLLAAAVVGTGLMLVRDFHRRVVHPNISGKYMAQTRFVILMTKDWYREDQETQWLQTQVRQMTSTAVLMPVVKRLELEKTWHTSADEAESRISRLTRTEFEAGTAVISVTVWGERSDETADIANAIRESYADLRRRSLLHSSELSPWISPQAQLQLEVVEKSKANLPVIPKKLGMAEPVTSPSDDTARPGGPSEYAAAHQRYLSETQLLNSLVERSMRGKADEDIIQQPIRVLEVAVAVPES